MMQTGVFWYDRSILSGMIGGGGDGRGICGTLHGMVVCCFGVLLRGVGNSICIEVGLIVYILG